MTPDNQIELGLHRALDVVSLPTAIPTDVLNRVKKDRTKRSFVAAVAVVVIAGFFATAGRTFVTSLEIQPTKRRTVPFERLPVEAGSRTLGLTSSPLAPAAFPDCTTDNVAVRPDVDTDSVSLTIRPHEGVQCGLDWWSEGFWTDASGEVYKPPRSRPNQYVPSGDDKVSPSRNTPPGQSPTRLLLMDKAGASHAGIVAGKVCGLQAPITFSIELAGDTVEIGTIEDPHCAGTDPFTARDSWTRPYFYRGAAQETPAGWLRPSLGVPATAAGGTLTFVLSLLNDTDEAISLGKCPFFDATFETATEKVHLRSFLNCPAAPDTIEPGDELRFPIELEIDSLVGSGSVEFVLRDENRPLARMTSSEITVEP